MKKTEITFSNFFSIGGKKVAFADMPEEERILLANQIIKQSLSTLQNVRVVDTA